MIKTNKLDKHFNKGKANENHVLKQVSVEIENKGLVCILGESGSGKTTLLNTIGGLDTFGSGSITIDDEVIETYDTKQIERLRNQKFGYIFQNYYLLQDYTVAYNIRLALNLFDMTEEEKNERVDYVLDALNMKKFKKKRISQLSGGQQQRVSIARALVKSPEIILADEPTGNLDEENTLKIMSILKSISKDCLVILVSHEKAIARFFADRIIEIEDGVIRKDYQNKAKESYQRVDDANIYLGDMDAEKMESKEIEVTVYQEKEMPAEQISEEQSGKIHLNLAWKDDKLYIQSTDEISLVLAGEESGCVMLDEKRPKLEQSQVEEVAYDLPLVKTRKRPELPGREVWKLAYENIQMMGKKHKFMVGILFATSILLVLALADYMMQHSVDVQSVVTEDSHYVTVSLEETASKKSSEMSGKVKEYCEKYVGKGEYKDAFVDTTGVLNLAYEGFSQIKQVTGKLDKYSVVSIRHLQKEDLIYGRMPENRCEFVIDQWLVNKFSQSGSILGVVYSNKESLLGVEVGTIVPGLNMKIVGISDTKEPSIYVYDNVALGMSYVGYYAISDQELRELYPEEYSDFKLADDEVYLNLSNFDEFEYENRWGGNGARVYSRLAEVLDVEDDQIKGHFPDYLGAEYALSQKNINKLRMSYIQSGRKFKIYTEDTEKAIKYFQSTGKDYSDYFEVTAVNGYQEQLKEYREEQKVNINAGFLVTLAVSLLSFIMVYFTIKSNVMARSEELTVYRLIGISRRSILKAYMLEMILITAYTCVPAVLVTSGIIKFITSIPSLQFNLMFPWWLAVALIAAMFAVNAVISILPVQRILRMPPAQLAAKN